MFTAEQIKQAAKCKREFNKLKSMGIDYNSQIHRFECVFEL